MSTRTDTERLAWLVAANAGFAYTTVAEVVEGRGIVSQTSSVHVRVPCALEWYCWHVYDTIDAAMDAPPCIGEEGRCVLSGRVADRGDGGDPVMAGPSLRGHLHKQLAGALARALADAPHDVWTALREGGSLDLDRFGDLYVIAERVVAATLDDAFASVVEARP